MRGGNGVRGQGRIRCLERHLHRERRIAKKNIGAGLEGDTQGLADQQRRKPAAIDEQIAGDCPGLARQHALDVAGLALFDFGNVRQHMAYAEIRGAVLREERRELAGIQMIGVVGLSPVLGAGDGLGRETVIAEPALGSHEIAETAPFPVTQPVRHEVHLGEAMRHHQGMIVGGHPRRPWSNRQTRLPA